MLLTAGLLLSAVAPAPALADRAGQVRTDANRLVSMLLDVCRKDPARTLSTADVFGPLSDPMVFREACGRGLDGHALIRPPDYTVFFQRERGDGGLFEVFGAATEVSFAGRRYRVLVGQTTRAAIRDGAVTEIETVPSAYAMEWQGTGWQQVWTFLDPVTGKDVLPREPFQDPAAPPGAHRFLWDLWRDHVTGSFHDLVFNMRDSRGVPLVQ
ncbi:hypothetical protein [Roseospira navarrensis]|uniref:Uncharacterized protein n=1 Tax=Roseospira navarrensis TaxID=140058 RepID=A0A7X1ZGR5_9PROT|nr:hypothetical protein [Roseospira navarrensis]MQX38165.1 hypothetical protein [Roseospira navarrensis]